MPQLSPMTSTPSALEMIVAARRGDPGALDDLLARFHPTVRRKVHVALQAELRGKRPWLVSMFSTGDVVQEVLVAVVRDVDSFRGIEERSFASYLATLVKNRLVDTIRFHEALRRDPRRASFSLDQLDHDVADSDADPAVRAVRADQIEVFCRIVAGFPTREAQLLRERLEHESPFEELAANLGYPSADAARKAFYAVQARLLTRLRATGNADRTTLDG